jgi:hypothetical protein
MSKSPKFRELQTAEPAGVLKGLRSGGVNMDQTLRFGLIWQSTSGLALPPQTTRSPEWQA